MKELKKVSVLCLMISFMMMFSCGGSDDNVEPDINNVGIQITNLKVQDSKNNGNGTDLKITFDKLSDESNVKEYRIFVVKTGVKSSFSLTVAENIPVDFYHAVTPTGSDYVINLSADFKDTDGELIISDVGYSVFVLSVSNSEGIENEISDASNSVIITIQPIVTSINLSGSFNDDITVDKFGDLYISDAFGGGGPTNLMGKTVYKVTNNNSVKKLSTTLDVPVGNAIDDDGNLYVTNLNKNYITKISPEGDESIYVSSPLLAGGGGITFDSQGNLYNTFFSSSSIVKISKEGIVETWKTDANFNGPVGLTTDDEDNIYLANFNDGKIFKITQSRIVSLFANITAQIGHIEYSPKGVFYASGFNTHKIYEISKFGEVKEFTGTGVAGNNNGIGNEVTFSSPNGIGVSPTGDTVYVSQANNKLRMIILE